MSSIPGMLLRHVVTVEPYLGDTPYGASYGPAFEMRCWLEESVRLTRDPDGHDVTSNAQVYARLGPQVPAQSRVTLPSGEKRTVLAALRHDGKGLPTPDHLEVHLQ